MIIIYNFESDIYFHMYIHVCINEDIVSHSQTQLSMKERSGDMQYYCFFKYKYALQWFRFVEIHTLMKLMTFIADCCVLRSCTKH